MNSDAIRLLALESSCDDTSAAVLSDRRVLSNIVYTQAIHKAYGGVIPEWASRSHLRKIIPVVSAAMDEAGIANRDLKAIAYTKGPGLPGSLIVGNAFAKSLSMALEIPLIEVNHMHAHIMAHFIEGVHREAPEFPFICLTISGGHTQLVVVNGITDLEIVGQTVDDAAGEAFDKIAKLLGMEYPGGPLLDKFSAGGDPDRFSFPRPRMAGFNYSFSGLKTAVLYFLRDELAKDEHFVDKNIRDICASVQKTIVEILVGNLERLAESLHIDRIALAGGVSANSGLRKVIQGCSNSKGWKIFIPPLEYCTDNAAMIGISGYYKYLQGDFANLESVPEARWYL